MAALAQRRHGRRARRDRRACSPQTGFRATELGLEGIQGFAKMFTDGNLDPAALLDGLGESWFIIRTAGSSATR